MAQIDIEHTKKQAREILDSRIDSVTALIKAKQQVTDLQSELRTAEREAKRAYVRATKDGWTADELKRLGLENNAASKRRGTATRQKTKTSQPSTPDATENETGSTTEQPEGSQDHG